MFKKYWPLLQSLLYVIIALLYVIIELIEALNSKGIFEYIFYGLAGILLLIALWQAAGLVAKIQKRGNTRDSDP